MAAMEKLIMGGYGLVHTAYIQTCNDKEEAAELQKKQQTASPKGLCGKQ